jgi:purine-binding chemotaxis protein CheW
MVRLKSMPCVVFRLDEVSYGVRLSEVVRVVRAVQITPLPKAPSIVMGVVNLEGRIIPVVNIRRRFRLPERDLELTDHLVIARISGSRTPEGWDRVLALVVDEVVGVLDPSAGEVEAGTILPGLEYLSGVAKTPQGLVLIHDLDAFLSLEEAKALAESLNGGAS